MKFTHTKIHQYLSFNLWFFLFSALVMATFGLWSAPTVQAITGSLDVTFATNGKVVTSSAGFEKAHSLANQSDGKIVVVGYADNGANVDMAIARYQTNGALDTTFDGDGLKTIDFAGFDDVANSVAIQSNGKIVVAGFSQVSDNGGIYSRFAVVRLNTDGALDTTFDGDGLATSSSTSIDEGAQSLVLDSNGRAVLGGFRLFQPRANGTNGYDFTLMRFKTNGNLDTTFGTSGTTTTYFGTSIASTLVTSISLQSDGKIIAAGEADQGFDIDLALARYDTSGNLDTTFGTSGTTTLEIGVDSFHAVDNLAIQTDDRIVVGGFLGSDFALARLTASGTPDTTFDTDGLVTTDFGSAEQVRAVDIQTDGKIVAAGAKAGDSAWARYGTNGSIDSTFGTNGITTTDFGGTDWVNDITIASDDKLNLTGTSGNDFVLTRVMNDAYEALEQTVSAGGTSTMDSESDGATSADPIETALTSPTAGTVTMTESTNIGISIGYTFLGGRVVIAAPTATAANPLVVVFQIDASLIPAGQTKDTIQIFRNGVLVPNCTGTPGTASPDPCVSSRVDLAGGDVQITVLTSTASSWDVGIPNADLPTFCDHTQAPTNAADKAKGETDPNSALTCP